MSDELDALMGALDVLLTAIVEEDRKVRETHGGAPIFQAAPVTAESLERSARMTRLELDVADIVRGPVRAACRQAVRRIGERLFKLCGTISAMSQIAEQVAALEPKDYGLRVSIIEHAWNGIGHGSNRWWT